MPANEKSPNAPGDSHYVQVMPLTRGFACGPLETLLQAAERAGIELPSSCRNGTCRTCLCRMPQGEVDYTVEWPGLSAEERAQGWTLPCVALPLSDLCLEQTLARTAD